MRLTLRTLLAYLDDILEPAQTREMGARIEESGAARTLIDRIREVLRRRRLLAPDLEGPGTGIDPNTVAEYLDNTLTPDAVADVERVCLESDVQLAEVAACHQVLTLVLGEPVSVLPQSRERMYALGPSPEEAAEQRSAGFSHPLLQPATRPEKPSSPSSSDSADTGAAGRAASAPVAGEDSREFARRAARAAVAVIASDDSPAAGEAPPLPGNGSAAAGHAARQPAASFHDSIPEHLRRAPLWKRALPATVVVAIVGVWLALLVRDPGVSTLKRNDQQPAGDAIAAADPPIPGDDTAGAVAGAGVAATTTETSTGNPAGAAVPAPGNGTATVDGSLPPMPRDPPPPPDEPETGLPVPGGVPVAGTTPPPGLNLPGAGSGTPAPAPVTPPAAAPPAAAPVPAAQALPPARPPVQIANTSDNPWLLLHVPGTEETADDWVFVAPRAVIHENEVLATTIPLDGRLRVTRKSSTLADIVLRTGTVAHALPPTASTDFGLNIHRGRVLIASRLAAGSGDAPRAAEPVQVELQVGTRRWILKLLQADTVCGIEVASGMPRGFRQLPMTRWFGSLVVRSGAVELIAADQPAADAAVVEIGESRGLALLPPGQVGDVPPVVETYEQLEDWLEFGAATLELRTGRKHASGARSLQRKLEGADSLSLNLPEIALDKSVGVSELATLTLALTGRYSDLIDVLKESQHQESRRAAVMGIRQWLVASPEATDELRPALQQRFFPEHIVALERLLWTVSSEDARSPEVSRLLVDMLRSDEQVIRELAFSEIYRLTGVTRLYNPLEAPSGQTRALEEWDRHLQQNGGALTPAGKSP